MTQEKQDNETFKSRDDVLTLLMHLGYLTWNEEESTAHVPNEEVREAFQQILEGTGASRKWMELLGRSKKLLGDTIAGDAQAVAKAITETRALSHRRDTGFTVRPTNGTSRPREQSGR